MASDTDSRKRKAGVALLLDALFQSTVCPRCSQRFDESERAPRNLASCGHTLCTACLGALVQQRPESARKWAINRV